MNNGAVRIGGNDCPGVLAGNKNGSLSRPRGCNAGRIKVKMKGKNVRHAGHACGIQAINCRRIRYRPHGKRDVDTSIGVDGPVKRASPPR